MHKEKHHFNGMFASLDCLHTYWKNCPEAWHGSFKGKENRPLIVLEAIANYHTFFWHASYGYAGMLNDHNVLHLLPFCHNRTNSKFETLEKESELCNIALEVRGLMHYIYW